MTWYEIAISVLTGLAAAIPLVVKLVEYVQKAVKEKNWNDLLKLVTNLMEEAESKFDNGADRKELRKRSGHAFGRSGSDAGGRAFYRDHGGGYRLGDRRCAAGQDHRNIRAGILR